MKNDIENGLARQRLSISYELRLRLLSRRPTDPGADDALVDRLATLLEGIENYASELGPRDPAVAERRLAEMDELFLGAAASLRQDGSSPWRLERLARHTAERMRELRPQIMELVPFAEHRLDNAGLDLDYPWIDSWLVALAAPASALDAPTTVGGPSPEADGSPWATPELPIERLSGCEGLEPARLTWTPAPASSPACGWTATVPRAPGSPTTKQSAR